MGDIAVTLTLEDILWICGALCTLAAAIAVIYKAHVRIHEPEAIQNRRLDALEAKADKFEEYLERDNQRLNAVDEGNRITLQALLALMSHAINGNDIEDLIRTKKDLEKYLIKK